MFCYMCEVVLTQRNTVRRYLRGGRDGAALNRIGTCRELEGQLGLNGRNKGQN